MYSLELKASNDQMLYWLTYTTHTDFFYSRAEHTVHNCLHFSTGLNWTKPYIFWHWKSIVADLRNLLFARKTTNFAFFSSFFFCVPQSIESENGYGRMEARIEPNVEYGWRTIDAVIRYYKSALWAIGHAIWRWISKTCHENGHNQVIFDSM